MNKRAVAIARSCGLRGFDLEDTAERIARRWRKNPSRNRLASAAAEIRDVLASRFNKPRHTFPKDMVSLSAIGQYEVMSRRYEEAEMWGAFSYHDRRFATENKVCPRCSSSKGSFRETYGACPCGFSY
jgi:hypothetical protein